jgi:pimeloyl-ACP methyl ester carboxylesterase
MGLALLTERMDLIGHSYGATVAMRMAIERPERVRSLTMIEPVYFAAAHADAPDAVIEHMKTLDGFNAAMAEGDHVASARAFSEQWGNGQRWEDIPERARRYMADRIYFVAGGQAFLHEDSSNIISGRKLESLPMPVLLIEGETAPEVVDVIHTAIARRVPNARRATIKGAGHMAPISHPKAVAAEIRALLEVAEEGVDLGI